MISDSIKHTGSRGDSGLLWEGEGESPDDGVPDHHGGSELWWGGGLSRELLVGGRVRA